MPLISKLKSPMFRNTLISSVDQGLLSMGNFLVTIILIKLVPKEEFGFFNVTLTVIGYFISLQNAIVTTPLIILLASKSEKQGDIFSSSLFIGQFRVVAFLSTLSALFFFSLYFLGSNSSAFLICSAASVSLIGILSREFFRALSYAKELASRALKQDVLYILIYLTLIILSYYVYHVNVSFTVLSMGLSTMIVYTLYNYRESIKVNWNQIKSAYSETWILGKWSLIGITVTHLQTYSYQYLILILLGTTAVAENAASRLLLMPLVLLQQGWGNVIRPRGAKLRQKNKLNQFYRELIIASIIITILICLYVIVIQFAGAFLQKILFTDNYSKSIDYIYFWGGVFIFQYIRSNASFGLQVIKKFKNIAVINSVTMIITILISITLIQKIGVPGALIASMAGEIIFGFILWYFFSSYIFGKEPKRLLRIIHKKPKSN